MGTWGIKGPGRRDQELVESLESCLPSWEQYRKHWNLESRAELQAGGQHYPRLGTPASTASTSQGIPSHQSRFRWSWWEREEIRGVIHQVIRRRCLSASWKFQVFKTSHPLLAALSMSLRSPLIEPREEEEEPWMLCSQLPNTGIPKNMFPHQIQHADINYAGDLTQNWHSEGKGSLAELGWPRTAILRKQHEISRNKQGGVAWGGSEMTVTNKGLEETCSAPYSILRALPRTLIPLS